MDSWSSAADLYIPVDTQTEDYFTDMNDRMSISTESVKSIDSVLAVVLDKSTMQYVLVQEKKPGINAQVLCCIEDFVRTDEEPTDYIVRIVKEKIGGIRPVVVTPIFTAYLEPRINGCALYGFYVEVDSLDPNFTLPSSITKVEEVGLLSLNKHVSENLCISVAQKYLYEKYMQYFESVPTT